MRSRCGAGAARRAGRLGSGPGCEPPTRVARRRATQSRSISRDTAAGSNRARTTISGASPASPAVAFAHPRRSADPPNSSPGRPPCERSDRRPDLVVDPVAGPLAAGYERHLPRMDDDVDLPVRLVGRVDHAAVLRDHLGQPAVPPGGAGREQADPTANQAGDSKLARRIALAVDGRQNMCNFIDLF